MIRDKKVFLETSDNNLSILSHQSCLTKNTDKFILYNSMGYRYSTLKKVGLKSTYYYQVFQRVWRYLKQRHNLKDCF